MRRFSKIDRVLIQVNDALNTVFSTQLSTRKSPVSDKRESVLVGESQRKSQGYMRVNHTGEVCAQALYRGQLVFAASEKTRQMLEHASMEETDHLAWTHGRLQELGTHVSYLNFFWYVNSFILGMCAAKWGDSWSLGFIEETERQVSRHLSTHLESLPQEDVRSRKIVEQMRVDEEQHGAAAKAAGAVALPAIVKAAMKIQSKIMTTITYYF